MEALIKHLEEVHGIVSFSIEKVLPVNLEHMVDERVAPKDNWVPGSIMMFSDDPKYFLSFDVWAYYSLRRDTVRNADDLIDIIAISWIVDAFTMSANPRTVPWNLRWAFIGTLMTGSVNFARPWTKTGAAGWFGNRLCTI